MISRIQTSSYRRISLQKILEKIVINSDQEALKEFHDHRTLFSLQNQRRLRCAEYVSTLRDSARHHSWGHLCDDAYSLTIDKFSRLPKDQMKGVDCRRYFRAALNAFNKTKRRDGIAEEMNLARIMQSLVYRHFRLSLKEFHRNGTKTRFEWRLPNGSISVMLPRELNGRDRSVWLATHVAKPDPSQPGEQFRVQAIIDQHFEIVSDNGSSHEPFASSDSPFRFADSWSVTSLAETIAVEKADRILEQRPAIQKLGPNQLKNLIRHVFERLSQGDYRDTDIANSFGLSKSSLSRFAGSHWKGTVPDLFINTARALTEHPKYVEAIRDAGLGNKVFRIEQLAVERSRI